MILRSTRVAIAALLAFFTCLPVVLGEQYVQYTQDDGVTVNLADNRRPALYTGNFGDCLGNSLINVSRFDAAYYKDNMTVLFHLEGTSGLMNESLMMYIGVFAYGESRFDLTFNPCDANIASLCPVNSSVPIQANGIIPVGPSDVANIPAIALTIPDFEGQAILRIFANSTQSEIGCYSAVVTNGVTFSQPSAVGTILGIFALIAVVSSFATAIYGESISVMRTHYAHSVSVLVVFAVFQHIFFTGALSMNWPSVLVAWWSNFAWAGGMINTAGMQASINNLIGHNVGNTSSVGAAAAGSTQESLGGGYDISQIYRRTVPLLKRDIASEIYKRDPSQTFARDITSRSVSNMLQRRALANSSTGYDWYGKPVANGLPLPGNYSGFAGTLAQESISASNAFMTGFLWLLILLVLLVGSVIAFKFILEGLVSMKRLRSDRLSFFRNNWIAYTLVVALRICYIAFFMIMFLTMFQFSYESNGAVKGIAAAVFVIFMIGVPACCFAAIRYRKKTVAEQEGHGQAQPVQSQSRLGRLTSSMKTPKSGSTASLTRLAQLGESPQPIHQDDDYTMKFGWLSARFRRSRWWFFAAWTFYEFLRACFYGAASGHAKTQVFGLLIVEILAFAAIAWARPFEGRRLNIIVVYCLGFSKVLSVALSAAFDVSFNLARITTTAIGIIIIVIQGLLTVITLIAIAVGAVSSYMSLTRNREEFYPRKWHGLRERYFQHLDKVAGQQDMSSPRSPDSKKGGSYFNVSSVRRQNKIEDDDNAFAAEMQNMDPAMSYASLSNRQGRPSADMPMSPTGYNASRRTSRAASMNSVSRPNLPFGARQHRPSWSTRDFEDQESKQPSYVNMDRTVPDGAEYSRPPSKRGHSRVPSRTGSLADKQWTRSNESLRTGGDRSTRDTIGKVPMPGVMPRAGTFSGRLPSHGTTPATSIYNGNTSHAESSEPVFGASERHGRLPLTPAEEKDEELGRRVSRTS